MMEIDGSKQETRSAFENRAVIYRYLFDELVAELGEAKAMDVMARAIRARGVAHSEKYRALADDRDFPGIGELFCSGSPCDGELFNPSVLEATENGVVLEMRSCPLVDAWRRMGLAESDVDVMCRIAAAVDEGTFEGAGLEVAIEERLGDPAQDRCVLRITGG